MTNFIDFILEFVSSTRLCPSLDTLVPFDSEKPYDIKDVIFNVSA